MSRRPSPTRAVAAVAGGLVVVVAVVVGVSSLAGRTRHPATPTPVVQDWDARAAAAFKPLATELEPLAHDVATWQTQGTPTTSQLASNLAAAGAVFAGVQAAVSRLPSSPAGAQVNSLYLRSVVLDESWLQVTEAAVAAPGGDLSSQLVLAGTRVRELADRVFDRGRALLAPLLPTTTTPGVETVAPADVPDWVAEGLAAGPPLALEAPPPGTGQPSVRQPVRPQQPRPRWRAAVAAAGVPASSAITAAVTSHDRAALLAAAAELDSAVARLFAQPDPAGDREGAARVCLGLLVDAEAARLGSTGGDMVPVARRLLAVGDGLWAADLGRRESGVPAHELTG